MLLNLKNTDAYKPDYLNGDTSTKVVKSAQIKISGHS